MPRVSRCDKLPEHDRLRLIGRIGDGATWQQLEAEFGIPFSSIREWALRNGYNRSPVEAKRQTVDRLLAMPETASVSVTAAVSSGNPDTDAAAERDAKVARAAANVAALCIKRLAETVRQEGLDPRIVKTVADALNRAWDTYARINKLDDVPSDAVDYAALDASILRKLEKL